MFPLFQDARCYIVSICSIWNCYIVFSRLYFYIPFRPFKRVCSNLLLFRGAEIFNCAFSLEITARIHHGRISLFHLIYCYSGGLITVCAHASAINRVSDVWSGSVFHLSAKCSSAGWAGRRHKVRHAWSSVLPDTSTKNSHARVAGSLQEHVSFHNVCLARNRKQIVHAP